MRLRRITYLPLALLLLFLANSFNLSCAAEPDSISRAIVVYGDTRTNHDDHRKVVEAIMKINPEVAFHVGDLVADGRVKAQWDVFFEISEPLLKIAEFYPVLGNHERNSQLYFDNFELPNNERWYSVDKYNIHFIILDSNVDSSIGSEQYNWLEADLKNRDKNVTFTAVVLHHPPYSTGHHKKDEKGLRETVVPLFEKYNVDIVFAGHDHDYERSLVNGIYYIVTGGGGAPHDRPQARTSPYSQIFINTLEFCALSIKDSQLLVEVFNEKSELIDKFSVE